VEAHKKHLFTNEISFETSETTK